MRLILIEDKQARVSARKTYLDNLCKDWAAAEHRRVKYKGGGAEVKISHNRVYWVAQKKLVREKVSHSWDAFGDYKATGGLPITVEINIPRDPNEKRVAGFFARDMDSGVCYLMHSGRVSGGRGVTQKGFLALSREKPVPVVTSSGLVRMGIIVAAVDSKTIGDDVARFITSVRKFKDSVSSGEFNEILADAESVYDKYSKEFSGNIKRAAMREAEYTKRHGDVVDALKKWREESGLADNEKIFNNRFIDLGVKNNGRLTEIYEVKTGCDRQSLYTATGQIIVHSGDAPKDCKRFLVLPCGPVAGDIERAFKREGVEVMRFKLTKRKVTLFYGEEAP